MREQVLPHSLEAERAVLGAVLMENTRLAEACEHVKPADFFRHAHMLIFRHMVDLAERGQGIDLLTLRESLTRSGDLERVDGPAYISSLIDGVPRGANVAHYAQIVREKASLRSLIAASAAMLDHAYAAEDEAAAILEAAENAILGLAEGAVTTGFESMKDIASRAMATLERLSTTKYGLSGLATGFADLDELTRGLQPGTLVTLAARPGVGKSSFAFNVATAAARAGRIVGAFNLEMTNDENFVRQLSAVAQIDSHKLQSGHLGERDWSRIAVALGQLSEAPLYLDESPGIGIFEVRSRSRRLKVDRGLDLIVIDYLQLMRSPDRHDNRNLEIGAITMALKGLSKELKVPVLLLSQLSRDVEKRGGKPRLSDLRDSGSIEQDSDIVLFLHRPDDGTGEPSTVTELIVAKHRNGPTGTVKLTWCEQQTRFGNYAPESAMEAR